MITITLRHLQKLLDEHRDKSIVSCDEKCFCWDIQAYINSFLIPTCAKCHSRFEEEDGYITMPYGSKYDGLKICDKCLIERIG